MQILKSYIFNKRASAHIRNEQRFVDYDSARTILILFESDFNEKNSYIRQIINELSADGKKVSAWGYIDKKEVRTANLPSYKIMGRNSVNWLGEPKELFLNELKNQGYDILIDLNFNDIIPLQYIALYADADMKAGKSRSNKLQLDFQLQLPDEEHEEDSTNKVEESKEDFFDLNETAYRQNQQYLFEQITFYLKRIVTKD